VKKGKEEGREETGTCFLNISPGKEKKRGKRKKKEKAISYYYFLHFLSFPGRKKGRNKGGRRGGEGKEEGERHLNSNILGREKKGGGMKEENLFPFNSFALKERRKRKFEPRTFEKEFFPIIRPFSLRLGRL